MSKRILIIEDDPKSLYALTSVLSERGHRVVGYHDAEDATAAAPADVDVAIVDVRLPRQQGPDYARQLRQKLPHARIILMTAYDSVEEIKREIPEATVVVKPLDINLLTRLF